MRSYPGGDGPGCASRCSGETATGAGPVTSRGRLEAHHEPPLREGSDPYTLDGIQTLCRGCHIRRHEADNAFPERREWRQRVNAILFHE